MEEGGFGGRNIRQEDLSWGKRKRKGGEGKRGEGRGMGKGGGGGGCHAHGRVDAGDPDGGVVSCSCDARRLPADLDGLDGPNLQKAMPLRSAGVAHCHGRSRKGTRRRGQGHTGKNRGSETEGHLASGPSEATAADEGNRELWQRNHWASLRRKLELEGLEADAEQELEQSKSGRRKGRDGEH